MNAPLPTPTDLPARIALGALVRNQLRRHTQAALRMHGEFDFDASAEQVFERATDPELIAGWFGMITGGRVDHSRSAEAGTWGEGSKRYCKTMGMGTLDETILYYDAPHACIYNVRNPMMPMENHAALMTVVPVERGARLTWQQYYDDRGLVMRHFFAKMMIPMINSGMAKLAAEVGGSGGKMAVVK